MQRREINVIQFAKTGIKDSIQCTSIVDDCRNGLLCLSSFAQLIGVSGHSLISITEI